MNGATRKELFQATLEGRRMDVVPSAPLYMSLYCEPIWRRNLADVYRDMADERPELPLSFDTLTEAHLKAWGRTWATFQFPPDWMRIRWGTARSQAEGSKVVLDDGSCVWHSADGKLQVDYLAPHHAGAGSSVDIWDKDVGLASESDLEALVPLQSWESWLEDGQTVWAERALRLWGDDFLLTGATGAPFWGAYSTLGFARLMRVIKQQPDVLEQLLARLLHNRMQYVRALSEIGVPCLFIEECFSGADIISEADFARLAWPVLRDMIAYAVDLGMLTVFYYTGQVEGRVAYLAQSTAHGLAFEEDKKRIRIDLAEIRRMVGPDRVLFGNLDVTVLRGAPKEIVLDRIAEQAEQAGPPFAASVGSPITLDTAPERISWISEAARAISSKTQRPVQSNSS